VEKDIWRDYLTNPREFDQWLKANAAIGSILAIGLLAMALAGHYSARSFDEATEYSSITRQNECTRHAGKSYAAVAQRRSEIYRHCVTD
jgi:hypothetical protein